MCNQSGSGNGIAVVTGASAGLGKIYADRLAKRKYDLLLVARRRERLDALASELEEKYGRKSAIDCCRSGKPAGSKEGY